VLHETGASDLVDKNESRHYPAMMFDKHNCDLYDQVHPMKWIDPQPDLVS